MFTNPITHTRLNSMEELLNFSVNTNIRSDQKKIFSYSEEEFAFTDCFGYTHVTPFRSGITEILVAAGYKTGALLIPADMSEDESYGWLKQIADEENWAETYERAYNISLEKKIQPVDTSTQKLQIKEIKYCFDDYYNSKKFESMVRQFLEYDTDKNIGTYIFIDEKTVLLCDEYGRTFLVKAKTVINDFVNALIKAGYTRTVHPEYYVHTLI